MKSGQMKRELDDSNPIINQDPNALVAYDTAGRPYNDESCTDEFLRQRGMSPKKQWNVPNWYQRPDRGGGNSSRNRKLQQQQNANPDKTP